MADEAVEEAVEAGVWSVIQRNLSKKGKVIFEGLEADARKFISDHFPRVHVEPGGAEEPHADAKLVSPDGVEEEFHGPETGFVPVKEDSE